MEAAVIVQIIEALASAAEIGYKMYNDTQSTLSETDANKIHEALLKAEAVTDALRAQVDAALDEASQR